MKEDGSNETLKMIKEENPSSNLKHLVIKCDVTDMTAINECFDKVRTNYNRPANILVNCAGIAIHAPILETTEEQSDKIIAVHLKGVYFMAQVIVF